MRNLCLLDTQLSSLKVTKFWVDFSSLSPKFVLILGWNGTELLLEYQIRTE